MTSTFKYGTDHRHRNRHIRNTEHTSTFRNRHQRATEIYGTDINIQNTEPSIFEIRDINMQIFIRNFKNNF